MRRVVKVKVGPETVEVGVDENTTVGDVKRLLGLEKKGRWFVVSGDVTVPDDMRVLEAFDYGDGTLRLLPCY